MTEVVAFLVGRCYSLKHIQQAHGLMVPRGLHQDNIALSRFIEACSSLGFSNYAYSVFTRIPLPQPNIYVYNTMIKALSAAGSPPRPYLFITKFKSPPCDLTPTPSLLCSRPWFA
ncbi:hypothetical protein M0R45_018076 [Rubus argutus]|uniref:Pentatricopeptide repeat-containing protein n=1 Tax=Rubus argutus TaxID=59490 RepID=A0AAW1XYD5_RUBAR